MPAPLIYFNWFGLFYIILFCFTSKYVWASLHFGPSGKSFASLVAQFYVDALLCSTWPKNLRFRWLMHVACHCCARWTRKQFECLYRALHKAQNYVYVQLGCHLGQSSHFKFPSSQFALLPVSSSLCLARREDFHSWTHGHCFRSAFNTMVKMGMSIEFLAYHFSKQMNK